MLETAQPRAKSPPSGSLLKHWLLTDLAEARRVLEAADAEPDRAIHLVRRRLKRVRTLFEVVKPVPGMGHAHRAQTVKEAFTLLSGHRDADAMLIAAKWLAERSDTALQPVALVLVDRLKAHIADLRSLPTPIPESLRLLRVAEAEAASLAEEPDPAKLLRDTLTAIYRKGRKRYRDALDKRDADDETLHDWRKQVKHRLHIGQMVEGTDLLNGPFMLKELDRLSEYLGEEHDFANLGGWICNDPVLGQTPRDLARLTVAISRRRSKLASRAIELGGELYGQRTSTFSKRLVMEG
jgi:CHAD domain-containing protein